MSIGLFGFVCGIGAWGYTANSAASLIVAGVSLGIIAFATWLIPEMWVRQSKGAKSRSTGWIWNLDRDQMLARLRGQSGQSEAVTWLDNLTKEQFDEFGYWQLMNFRWLLAHRVYSVWPYVSAAAVRALERIDAAGFDGHAAAIVEDDEVMEPLRGVARRCLPRLRQYTEQANAQGLLLRPSYMDPQPGWALLRPAANEPTDHEHLLRVGTEAATD